MVCMGSRAANRNGFCLLGLDTACSVSGQFVDRHYTALQGPLPYDLMINGNRAFYQSNL